MRGEDRNEKKAGNDGSIEPGRNLHTRHIRMLLVYYSISKRAFMRAILLILSILSILSNAFAQSPTPADEVKSLQENANVKAAMNYIDKNHDGILREWIAITEINAPSKQERERAKFIESLLRKHKLDIRYDSAGNLIATRKGTGG